MRYHATVAGKQFTAEVETLGDGRFAVTVDGERCELNWAPSGGPSTELGTGVGRHSRRLLPPIRQGRCFGSRRCNHASARFRYNPELLHLTTSI